MEQFWTIFWSSIGVISTGLASWLVVVIVNWLNSKIKDKKLAQWSTEAIQIVFNAVQAISQEFVETLKKEGKFDDAAKKEVREKAYAVIVSQLRPELKDYISNNFGDMRVWILNQIEATLYQLKR